MKYLYIVVIVFLLQGSLYAKVKKDSLLITFIELKDPICRLRVDSTDERPTVDFYPTYEVIYSITNRSKHVVWFETRSFYVDIYDSTQNDSYPYKGSKGRAYEKTRFSQRGSRIGWGGERTTIKDSANCIRLKPNCTVFFNESFWLEPINLKSFNKAVYKKIVRVPTSSGAFFEATDRIQLIRLSKVENQITKNYFWREGKLKATDYQERIALAKECLQNCPVEYKKILTSTVLRSLIHKKYSHYSEAISFYRLLFQDRSFIETLLLNSHLIQEVFGLLDKIDYNYNSMVMEVDLKADYHRFAFNTLAKNDPILAYFYYRRIWRSNRNIDENSDKSQKLKIDLKSLNFSNVPLKNYPCTTYE